MYAPVRMSPVSARNGYAPPSTFELQRCAGGVARSGPRRLCGCFHPHAGIFDAGSSAGWIFHDEFLSTLLLRRRRPLAPGFSSAGMRPITVLGFIAVTPLPAARAKRR